MIYGEDPLDTHTQAVDSLGIAPPDEWLDLRIRFDAFASRQPTAVQRLTDAFLDGDDVDDIYPLAIAEVAAMPPHHAQVVATLKAAVLTRLRTIYEPHALANYKTVAAQFDSAATKFTNAVVTVDCEQPAAQLINAPEKLRKAWSDSEQLACRLSALMTTLQAAAALAGVSCPRSEEMITLCVDTIGLHRRRVWEAWEATGTRTGRWGALVALGARVRAHNLNDGFEPYAQPKPMEVRQIRQGPGIRQVPFDPEDELQTAAV